MNAPDLDQLRAELAGELSDWAESQQNGTATQTDITPARAATWLFDLILLACTDHSGRWRTISYPELVFRMQAEGPKHEGALRAALPDIMCCRRRHGHGPVRFGDGTTTTAAETLLRLWENVKEHFAPRHRKERILWDAIGFALGRAPELVKTDVAYFCAAVELAQDVTRNLRKYFPVHNESDEMLLSIAYGMSPDDDERKPAWDFVDACFQKSRSIRRLADDPIDERPRRKARVIKFAMNLVTDAYLEFPDWADALDRTPGAFRMEDRKNAERHGRDGRKITKRRKGDEAKIDFRRWGIGHDGCRWWLFHLERDGRHGRWESRGEIDIPAGNPDRIAKKLIQTKGSRHSAIDKGEALALFQPDYHGKSEVSLQSSVITPAMNKLRQAVRSALSRVVTNATVSADPIPWDKTAKVWESKVVFGTAMRDDNGKLTLEKGNE